MASLVNDQAIKEHGSRVYAEAVGALTNLLHGHNEIEKDETLLAIYLLSFYEVCILCNAPSLNYFQSKADENK